MPNLTVRNIPPKLYRSLQQAARRSGRSLNAEILALLADEDAWNRRRWQLVEAIPRLAAARKELAKKYPKLRESVASIREDRDSR
jgi:plasmid stability protein